MKPFLEIEAHPSCVDLTAAAILYTSPLLLMKDVSFAILINFIFSSFLSEKFGGVEERGRGVFPLH